MKLATIIGKAFLLCLTFLYFSVTSWGQSNNYQGNVSNLEQTELSGFSDDERIKLLLLNLLPAGMTETAAAEIAKALQLNIYNTNHFSVVGPAEWNAEIKDQNPTLADCHDMLAARRSGNYFVQIKFWLGRFIQK